MEEEIKKEKGIIEEKTRKLSEKFKSWLKDPYNKILFVFIILLIILKFYWFFQTLEQPLWWDEADYMNMAKAYIGKGDYWKYNTWFTGSDVVRPILLPATISLILLAGLSETAVRFFVLLCSIISVPLIYGVGKLFFDKKTALFSSIILGTFWSFNFYTYRILVELPLVMLWLLTIYTFFYAYFNNKNWKYFVVAGIFLAFSFLMKYSSWLLVFIILIYLVVTEKFAILKNKKVMLFFVSALVALIPFFIYEYSLYGNILAPFAKVAGETRAERCISILASFFEQLKYSFYSTKISFLLLSILGLFSLLLSFFFLYNKITEKMALSNKLFFIFIWILFSAIFFAFFVTDIGCPNMPIDERYYFVFYPALFLLAGKGCAFIYEKIKHYDKTFAVVVIILLLGFGCYQNITLTKSNIEAKKDSPPYSQFKQAGLFIKENTGPNDKVMLLEEVAEISYYSERNFIHIWGDNETGLSEKIKAEKPKYVVLSFYIAATSEDALKTANLVFNNPSIFSLVKSYGPYVDQAQTVPIVAIFEINSNIQ